MAAAAGAVVMQASFAFGHELIIDLFAGGGGASEGIKQAFGRDPDIAVNHDADAVGMHTANHPGTRHLISDVFEVNPSEATQGKPVGLLWASPDCKHFSKAKGGKPRSKKIRGLAWVVVKWAKFVRPRMIILENVEEFQTWGPLVNGQPCPERKGQTFHRWLGQLRGLGYKVEFRELRACDYGAPTIRKRFFLVARCDGQPIVWPKPTHGKPDCVGVKSGKLQAWRTAADCIDWSLPVHSIFLTPEEARKVGVKRPLAPATLRRIAKGIDRFVLKAARPFIVPLTHTGGDRVHDINEPARTVTTARRGELALSVPTLIQTGYGERAGQEPRAPGLDKPLGTVVAAGVKHALVSGFLTKYRADSVGSDAEAPFPTITANGESDRPGGNPPLALIAAHLEQANAGGYDGPGRAASDPLSTITATGSQQRLAFAHLTKLRGDNVGAGAADPLHTVSAQGTHHALAVSHLQAFGQNAKGTSPAEPAQTVMAGATRYAEVRAFLVKFYGQGGQHSELGDPMHTIPTRDRMGLVTVDGTDYAIADIGLRMLTPRELFRAQGFPECYVIDRGHNGRKLPKDAQVRMCGNSVCPQLARALVLANCARIIEAERVVAA